MATPPRARALGLLLLLVAVPGRAVAEARTLPLRPSIVAYDSSQGLPHNTVQSLAQDGDGRLWVGTQNGVSSFDGAHWTELELPSDLPSRWITALLPARAGGLWVGTAGGGLLHYRGHELRRWTLADGLPNLEVLSLAESGPATQPTLWIGTRSGLARLEGGGRIALVPDSPAELGSEVQALAIAEQPSGTLVFVGTPRGLGWWDGTQWSWRERDSRGEPLQGISALLPAPPGEPPAVWVGSATRGLLRWQAGELTPWAGRGSGLPSDRVTALTVDGGALWVGTDSGAARWDGETWQVFDVRSSGLPANLVRALLPMVDAGRRLLWIGLRDGGLARLTLDGWSTLDLTGAGLATNAVYSFGESGPPTRPVYWLGTETGELARWEEGRWTRWSSQDTPIDSGVNALAFPPGGRALWVGTENGLLLFDGTTWRRFTHQDGLPDDRVLSLLLDLEVEPPVLWVGTRRGLARATGPAFRSFEAFTPSPIAEAEVHCLAAMGQGSERALWLGTRREGLVRLQGGRFELFSPSNSPLPDPWVNDMAVDPGRRALWLGTDAGVVQLDLSGPEPGWTVLDGRSEPPLPNALVYAVEVDAQGRAYLSTARGVVRLSRETTAAGPLFRLETFGTEDGLPGLEGNQGGLMRDRQGRIWAGMFNGVGILDISEAAPVQRLRELKVRSLAVDGQSWALSAPALELPPNPRELVVAVTLPSYLDRSSVRYQAQLVGLQAEPSAWATADSWSYPELPPGNYRFRAWARDRTGAVLAAPELVLRVPPTFWQRLSVRLGLVASALLLTTALLRARWVSERSQEEGYRRIFEGAQDAIIVFDPSTEEILAVNARACELYGWSREEMVGRTIKAFSTDIPRGEQEILRTLEQGAHHHFETRQLDRKGRVLDLECTASVIRYGGRAAILSLNRDLSERRKALELSLAKEAAERSAQAKSRFLASMSHEMRTPLTSILGALGLLGRVDLDQAQELIVIARRNAERLLGLVNDLLDLQQAEAGEMKLELGPVDLRQVVEETLSNLQGMAQGRDVALVLEPAQGDPATVRADAVRLGQVVANLLSNAIKFTARATAVTVRIEALAGRWRVSVIDQGPGVPEEFRSRIFERFAQADSSDKRAYGGTGLGLSIAKSFVEAMGGSIDFESVAGQGTTFYFELTVLPTSGST